MREEEDIKQELAKLQTSTYLRTKRKVLPLVYQVWLFKINIFEHDNDHLDAKRSREMFFNLSLFENTTTQSPH